jgi:hypothetical protein
MFKNSNLFSALLRKLQTPNWSEFSKYTIPGNQLQSRRRGSNTLADTQPKYSVSCDAINPIINPIERSGRILELFPPERQNHRFLQFCAKTSKIGVRGEIILKTCLIAQWG